MTVELHVQEGPATFFIHVNVQPVQVEGRRHTGAQIKEVAITQGVDIRPNFALYLERAHDKTKHIRDDEIVEVDNETRFLADEQTILVHVNNKPVRVEGRHQVGLVVKEAAIAQGVKIQLDFLLYEFIGHGHTRLIGDDQEIEVSFRSRFDAVPDDDHS